MLCKTVKSALSDFAQCETTPNGARILTHCLYPSFSSVAVYVVKFGEGFIVHDNGDAKAMAWDHGRDDRIATRYLNEQATRHGLKLTDGKLSVTVESAEWLASGILSVANAAAAAVNSAVEHVGRSAMVMLQEAIQQALVGTFAKSRVSVKPTRKGHSGREYEFDFAVSDAGRIVLIDAVTPYAISINSKYTAFSDVQKNLDGRGFVVFERPLLAPDKTLLAEVADVVPFKTMTAGVQRVLVRA